MWVTTSTADVLRPTAIALGNFDGVHLGHQKVLQPILPLPNSTVVTFNPHPQEFFTGQSRQLLTPLAEKEKQLERLGIEQLILLPFDRELAALSPQEFVAEILVQQLQAKRISVGADFRFGHQRQGTAADLNAIAANFGVKVSITHLQTCTHHTDTQSVRISSSLIRQALAQGKMTEAKQMLGRAYSLTGKVIDGQKLGRTLGFPTANIQLPGEKLLPRYGVYGVRVTVAAAEDEKRRTAISPSSIDGVMNIGCRPTVEGKTPTVEIHLLNWSGDLYNQTLTVSLETFLRPEQKFPSLDALKAQIAADCDTARAVLSTP